MPAHGHLEHQFYILNRVNAPISAFAPTFSHWPGIAEGKYAADIKACSFEADDHLKELHCVSKTFLQT